jgi:hypothetical protein
VQFGNCDAGSSSLARQWQRRIAPVTTVEDTKNSGPDIQCVKFPNGEWVCGLARDSHGWRQGGGTLVVKDSRGQMRVFFGHVCGAQPCFLVTPGDLKNLDAFYKYINTHWGFTEQVLN